jgi:hypothetical protein
MRQAPDAAPPFEEQTGIKERCNTTIGALPQAIIATNEMLLATDAKCGHGGA